MAREIKEVEDILSDDSFRSWYLKEDNEAAREWANWTKAHPEKAPLVEKAILLMQSLPKEKPVQADTDAAWEKILQAAGPAKPGPRAVIRPFWRWAAAAAAAAIIGFWAVRQYDIKNPEQEWQTAYGRIDTVNLADGSMVILNANSRLRGRDLKKGQGDRELWLEGEAFFQVNSTGNGQRFIVHTSEADVVVTGTRFNVRDRKDGVSVLLTEGRVHLLDKNGKQWDLRPGELAGLKDNQVQINRADSTSTLAWQKGMIVLDKTSPQGLASLVKEHYGKDLIIQGETRKTLNGMMPNNQLNDLLRAVELTTEWKVQTAGDSILIVVN